MVSRHIEAGSIRIGQALAGESNLLVQPRAISARAALGPAPHTLDVPDDGVQPLYLEATATKERACDFLDLRGSTVHNACGREVGLT